MASKSSAGPRQRLLDAADKLFYEDGIHAVGIDRLLEEAGVAKASLYSTFGSKDALIGEYLTLRLARRRERVLAAISAHEAPRARIRAVFDVLEQRVAEREFRGCAFFRASAQGQPSPRVDAVVEEARSWLRALFTELARSAGARAPERLAAQLVLLYDGATLAAQLDGDLAAPQLARATAETLLDAACS